MSLRQRVLVRDNLRLPRDNHNNNHGLQHRDNKCGHPVRDNNKCGHPVRDKILDHKHLVRYNKGRPHQGNSSKGLQGLPNNKGRRPHHNNNRGQLHL